MTNTPPPPGASPPPPQPPPPPAGTPTPAAASTGGLTLGPGAIVALIGAAIVAVSTLLSWIDFEGSTLSAHNIPATFLLNDDNGADGGLGIGWLLILLMAAVVIGVFINTVRWLAVVGGAAAAVVVLLFIFQLNSFVDERNEQARSLGVETVGFFDVMAYWPFLTLVGAIAAIVGGAMSLRRA